MCSAPAGKSFDPPTPKHFSFNAPAGACPVCHSIGQKMIFDEHLVAPDPEQPLESAIQRSHRAGKRIKLYSRRCCAPSPRISTSIWKRPGKTCRTISKRSCCTVRARTRWISISGARQPAHHQPPVRGRAAEPGTAVHRERKRICPQPHQALHEPAILRRLQRPALEAGNPGGDAGG